MPRLLGVVVLPSAAGPFTRDGPARPGAQQFRRWRRRRLLRTPKCLRTSWTSGAGKTASAVAANSPAMLCNEQRLSEIIRC